MGPIQLIHTLNSVAAGLIPSRLRHSAPSNSPVTMLKQSDFEQGIYRIQEPGVYRFAENIVFDPYIPAGSRPWFMEGIVPDSDEKSTRLGDFAAITVECDDVTIDGNGYTLSHGRRHRSLQRFFSSIQLNDRMFEKGKGPIDFGELQAKPENVTIKNLKFVGSSHFHIAGSHNKNVTISNCKMEDFDTAAIWLNGPKDVLIENCSIGPSAANVMANAKFSGAINMLRGAYTVLPDLDEHAKRLSARAMAARQEILRTGTTTDELFKPPSIGTDQSVFGIVVRPSVDFVQARATRDTPSTAEDVRVVNCEIFGLRCTPRQYSALLQHKNEVARDMVAHVFDVDACDDGNGGFKPNELILAQASQAMRLSCGYDLPSEAASGCPYANQRNKSTLARSQAEFILNAKKGDAIPSMMKVQCGGDAMHHRMRGCFGIQADGVTGLVVKDVRMSSLLVRNDNRPPTRCDQGMITRLVGCSMAGCDAAMVRKLKFDSAEHSRIVADSRFPALESHAVELINGSSGSID